MNTQKKELTSLKGFYLFTFFAMGSIAPLLSVYLNKVQHLNGLQIGTIMSIGPIMMIFFQPFWGILTDKLQAPRKVLGVTTLVAGISGLGYLWFDQFALILAVAILVAIFQSAIIPVSDSISLQYTSRINGNYGNIRLFGSLGYALAVFIIGRLSEMPMGLNIIFYSFFLTLLFSSILSSKLPKENTVSNINILKGIKELFTMKKFLIFLAITFLIFGPNLANNTYFGLFVEDRGGTYAGIGTAFFIAVLSEIPFMKVASNWINKWGLLPITMLAGVSSLLRWVFYYTEPSLWLIYSSAVIQGLAVGLFLPAGLQYIREITPVHITVTAVTIYSAIGNGLGNWFHTFVGGIIMDKYDVYTVFLFFGLTTLIGIGLNIWLYSIEKRTNPQREMA